jgi:K+-sensing histidine kinase KdpD
MNSAQRSYLAIIAGVIALGALIGFSLTLPWKPVHFGVWLFLTLLIIYSITYAVPMGGGYMSLLPLASLTTYLVTGLLPAAWAALAGAVVHGLLRGWIGTPLERQSQGPPLEMAGLAAANAAIQTLSILAAGLAYQALGGSILFQTLDWAIGWRLLVLAGVYLLVNYVLLGVIIWMRGGAAVLAYVRTLPSYAFYEFVPLVFTPLAVLTYAHLGIWLFGLLMVGLVVASLIAYNLAHALEGLRRRVRELDSLQAVGKALSASLDLAVILEAVHAQVAALMPAQNFYVALYDPQTREVAFPFVVEEGQRVRWRSRQAGNGLTEYLLRSGEPLLICENLAQQLQGLGVEVVGRVAASWLGVPIKAGNDCLGVIAVQAYTEPRVYDASHQEVLTTIAAQAAIAIQNARLYARTDEALARRVQELDSILRTTAEGMLLLDPSLRILAANRALGVFLGVTENELHGQLLTQIGEVEGAPFLQQIGYADQAALMSDLDILVAGKEDSLRQEIALNRPVERTLERTLAAVRGQAGTIVGWLLLLRDRTDEKATEQLREDMLHMIIHDLRAPLTTIMGSLTMIEDTLSGSTRQSEADELVGLARRGGQRMLNLVNQLLEIGELEDGRIRIHPVMVNCRDLFADVTGQMALQAADAQIDLSFQVAGNVPELWADPEVLGRVLYNLVDNALKFTPNQGRVYLTAQLETGVTPSWILVKVSDTGPGVPLEAQPRLFKKFQRVAATKGRRRGTGLGLYYCRLAVEAHDGQIWIENGSSLGSTFCIRLPVVPL